MSDFTEKVQAILDGRDKQGWHKDPLNRISVIRKCTGNESPGMHDLICQCNGQSKDIALSNVDFITAAPTILREAIERIEALEKVAYHAWQYCECMRPDREKKHVEYHPEYHFRQNLAKALEELSALDAADAEEK